MCNEMGPKRVENKTFVNEIIFNAPYTACRTEKCFRYLQSRE